jgi:hypothetical protein
MYMYTIQATHRLPLVKSMPKSHAYLYICVTKAFGENVREDCNAMQY